MLNINLTIGSFGSALDLPFSKVKMRAEEIIWLLLPEGCQVLVRVPNAPVVHDLCKMELEKYSAPTIKAMAYFMN